jgi:hypothetical protein
MVEISAYLSMVRCIPKEYSKISYLAHSMQIIQFPRHAERDIGKDCNRLDARSRKSKKPGEMPGF